MMEGHLKIKQCGSQCDLEVNREIIIKVCEVGKAQGQAWFSERLSGL